VLPIPISIVSSIPKLPNDGVSRLSAIYVVNYLIGLYDINVLSFIK
jgi:hypothetical protein